MCRWALQVRGPRSFDYWQNLKNSPVQGPWVVSKGKEATHEPLLVCSAAFRRPGRCEPAKAGTTNGAPRWLMAPRRVRGIVEATHEPSLRSGVSAERRHFSEEKFAALCRDAATIEFTLATRGPQTVEAYKQAGPI